MSRAAYTLYVGKYQVQPKVGPWLGRFRIAALISTH